MSYTKQTWTRGDTITAEKLNHMEDGISNCGVMVIHSTYDSINDNYVLDKTWQEITDALSSDIVCIIINNYINQNNNSISCYFVSGVSYDESDFEVQTLNSLIYGTNTSSGYPISLGLPV